MKNLLIALAMALPCAAHAADSAAVAPVLQTQFGTLVSNVAAPNLTFIGAPEYRIEVSTPTDTPILLLSGQGLLYSVECSSGAYGAYAMAFDSASASGITVATAGKALTSEVYTSAEVSDTSLVSNTIFFGNKHAYDISGNPSPFSNGLVGIVHKGVANCIFKARLTAGNNPGH